MNKLVSQDQYFATHEDPDVLASALITKITDWRVFCQSKGLIDVWYNKLKNYYGTSANGNSSQSINKGGSEGELSLIKVNDLHSLIQAQLVLVTSNRPAGQARAINSDTRSLKSARIGTAISEYYMSNLGLEAKFVQLAEMALLNDESFLDIFWDKETGDPIAVDEMGKPIMSGDTIIRLHSPWNVARDAGAKVEDQHWFILSFPVNKWDAAATYPKFHSEIVYAENDNLPEIMMNKLPDGTDMVYAHLLIHDRTPALPSGRYSLMIANKIVLDTDLPYKDFPVERLCPSIVIDGALGYSGSNDIMGLEQITDTIHSQITTNNINFGGQNIVGPKGSGLNVSDLAKGTRFFELEPDMVDKLKPLMLNATSPDSFRYIQTIDQKKEQATGSVSGTLSQQAIQGASGSAMALIQAQSIQYNSGIQRSYFRLLSATMTKIINVLRSYADTPRVARIVGKSNASGLKEFRFTGEDLNSISSIVFEMTNPISQTVGGRLSMAQDLIKAGMCKNAKQYITVATTGSLEALTEDDEADQMLILEENEALMEGRPVQAVITEMHEDHIKSHMSVLSSVTAKEDPQLVSAVLGHIDQHIMLWTQASQQNPGILMATKQNPLMPMMPPPGMGPPGAPQGPQQVMGGGEPPAMQQVQEVRKPQLPVNPATKERAVVPGAEQVQ
jgi:hypothetical protein